MARRVGFTQSLQSAGSTPTKHHFGETGKSTSTLPAGCGRIIVTMSRNLAAVLGLLALGVAGLAAEPPEVLKVLPHPLEGFRPPPGAVIVVSGNPRSRRRPEALQRMW